MPYRTSRLVIQVRVVESHETKGERVCRSRRRHRHRRPVPFRPTRAALCDVQLLTWSCERLLSPLSGDVKGIAPFEPARDWAQVFRSGTLTIGVKEA